MMDLRMMRRGVVVSVVLVGIGCAHKRQVFYPIDHGGSPAGSRPGVRVRAPFVDVQVHEAPHPLGAEPEG
jgi:hypothetical protein